LSLRAMPDWARPLAGWLMPRIGPRGVEFARARLEMKAAETVLHLRRAMPSKMKNMVPDHVWRLLKPYGITPEPGERYSDGVSGKSSS
ncbi:MAG: coenzyme F420 hydrogenase, partial [Pseudomonadota bacterium]